MFVGVELIISVCSSDQLSCRMQSVQTREFLFLCFFRLYVYLFVFRYTGAQVREQLVVLDVVYSLSCNELF